jgi:hypothetical protein
MIEYVVVVLLGFVFAIGLAAGYGLGSFLSAHWR